MAAETHDSFDGHPIFLGSGAPEVDVDPTEVAEYAADVGNKIIRDTAGRLAYPYVRKGLSCYDTDDGIEYVWDGSKWSPAAAGGDWTNMVGVTPTSGWTISGNPQIKIVGGMRMIRIRFTYTSGPNIEANSYGNISDVTMATIPVSYLPSGYLEQYVAMFVPGYATGGGRIQPDGAVVLTDLPPTMSFGPGKPGSQSQVQFTLVTG